MLQVSDLSGSACALREELHKASLAYIQGSADLSPFQPDTEGMGAGDAEKVLADYLADRCYVKAVAALSHYR